MGLKAYRSKRTLEKTPEPKGSKKSPSKHLQFVVQKHDARNLHYDFRLELDGILKSWAIPKGPSLDSSVKRLAIEVEDHPLEYGSFEGTIPKGNYGAGKVIVWDRGSYAPVSGEKTIREQEKSIREQLKKGELKLVLFGEKLRGEFALIRIGKDERKNQWLLIKKKDEYESSEDVTKNVKSVISGDTIEGALSKAAKGKIPHHIKPMLAYLLDKPFNDKDWIFEIKWDGYRALAEVSSKKVHLYSRNFLSFDEMFPAVLQALKKIKTDVVLDGEVVVFDKKGKSQFQLLQNYLRSEENQGALRYCIFDILYYDGRDLRDLSLIERKKILQDVIDWEGNPILHLSDSIEGRGIDFFKAAKKQGLEGIIGKEKQSHYVSKRSRSWVKVKSHQRQEAVIGGFTQPRGSRKRFGALLLGIYENSKLIYVGHVGGGFDESLLEDLHDQLIPLITDKCPFSKQPKTNTPATWVKPKIVCEVSFQEWTSEGIMRQPIFHGIREDKVPKSVKREVAEK
jgi:bifunctional non-homologous end joining protein LigD